MTIYRTQRGNDREERFVQTNIEEEGAGILGAPLSDIRVAVVGSRTFFHYSVLEKELDTLLSKNATLLSGGAGGADALAEKYAREHGRTIEVIRPDWETYGPSAGYRRNREIVKKASRVIAFWDGKSRGTDHIIQLARAEGIPVHVVRFASE
ncbi:MAG TPA: SLOG family protein [bacterium]|nr:SLOG family protein [bacterium]